MITDRQFLSKFDQQMLLNAEKANLSLRQVTRDALMERLASRFDPFTAAIVQDFAVRTISDITMPTHNLEVSIRQSTSDSFTDNAGRIIAEWASTQLTASNPDRINFAVRTIEAHPDSPHTIAAAKPLTRLWVSASLADHTLGILPLDLSVLDSSIPLSTTYGHDVLQTCHIDNATLHAPKLEFLLADRITSFKPKHAFHALLLTGIADKWFDFSTFDLWFNAFHDIRGLSGPSDVSPQLGERAQKYAQAMGLGEHFELANMDSFQQNLREWYSSADRTENEVPSAGDRQPNQVSLTKALQNKSSTPHFLVEVPASHLYLNMDETIALFDLLNEATVKDLRSFEKMHSSMRTALGDLAFISLEELLEAHTSASPNKLQPANLPADVFAEGELSFLQRIAEESGRDALLQSGAFDDIHQLPTSSYDSKDSPPTNWEFLADELQSLATDSPTTKTRATIFIETRERNGLGTADFEGKER